MIAGRSCDDCERYMYNDGDESGRMGDRIILLAGGAKWERPKGIPTPCHKCPKVPRDKRTARACRADAIEPTPLSWAILWHYRACKAVNEFPRALDGRIDPLVKRHAGLIAEVVRAVERAKMDSASGLLSLLFSQPR